MSRGAAPPRYVATLYFAGPLTGWAGVIDGREVIARYAGPYLWTIKLVVRNTRARLFRHKCGYVITRDGVLIEHAVPESEEDAPEELTP